jgi:hypothetical protein
MPTRYRPSYKPTLTAAVTTLIQQRLSDLLQDDDSPMEQLTMEELVFFVVVEPGETIPATGGSAWN